MIEKKCKWKPCGKAFQPKAYWQKYCRDACKLKAYRKRKKSNPSKEATK